MKTIKGNRDMFRILLEIEEGPTKDEEFDKAYDLLIEDIDGNMLKNVNQKYILKTLKSCLGLVRRLN